MPGKRKPRKPTLEEVEDILSRVRDLKPGEKYVVPRTKQGVELRKKFQSIPRELWPWDRLAENRKKTPLGSPHHRYCAKCKTQPAVIGSQFCRHHGGRKALIERMQKVGMPVRVKSSTAAFKILRRVEADGALDWELRNNPAWQRIQKRLVELQPLLRAGARCPRGERTPEMQEAQRERVRLVILLSKLAHGWLAAKERGDTAVWVKAVDSARRAGFA